MESTLYSKKKSVMFSKQETILILKAYRKHPTKWGDILLDVKSHSDTLPADAQALYRSSSNKQLRDRICGKFGKLLNKDLYLINDDAIRSEVLAIRKMEKRMIKSSTEPNDDSNEDGDGDDSDADGDNDDGEIGDKDGAPQNLRDKKMLKIPLSNDKEEQNYQKPKLQIKSKKGKPVYDPFDFNQTSSSENDVPAALETNLQQSSTGRQMSEKKRKGSCLTDGPKEKQKKKSKERMSLGDLIRDNQMKYNKFISKQVPKLLKTLGVSSDSESDTETE